MTSDQKEWVQSRLAREQDELQHLEAGQWPVWVTHRGRGKTPSLDERRMYADWCLKAILMALLPTLPKALRVTVQACFDLRERIWSIEYMNVYHEAQQKASPECLAASDSL